MSTVLMEASISTTGALGKMWVCLQLGNCRTTCSWGVAGLQVEYKSWGHLGLGNCRAEQGKQVVRAPGARKLQVLYVDG
jgi:hypothetical protein